jgi:hypothetical protein
MGEGLKVKMRTRIQENKFGQAIGYAYGARDFSRDTKDLVLDVSAWATFYSMLEELGGHHRPLQDAYRYFRELTLGEQKAYGNEWQRRPWSLYEEMHPSA